MEKTIQWKSLADDYEISEYGVVRRTTWCKRVPIGHILKAHSTPDGYMKVTYRKRGKSKTIHVHILVARKFIGPCPDGKEVNHKDLDKKNNHYSNLEYRTHKSNIKHAVSHGAPFRGSGENLGNGKLKIKEVKKIRELYSTGAYTQKRLGKKFGVTEMAIWQIVNDRVWKDVA